MTNKKKDLDLDLELTKERNAYFVQIYQYIYKKAGNDIKVALALGALIPLDLYQFTAPILAPMCPEDFQIQVVALKSLLDKVFDSIHSDNIEDKAREELAYMIASRLKDFIVFIGKCAGLEVKLEVNPDNPEEYLTATDIPQPSTERRAVPQPSPTAMEQMKMLVKALEGYHSQLVEYILQKTNGDSNVPVALMAYEIVHLQSTMADVFLPSCPQLFTGSWLEYTIELLKPVVKLLLGAFSSEEAVDAKNLSMLNSLVWRESFLEDIAICYGIDLQVELVPRGNGVELKVMKYEPLKKDSQEAPAD